MTTSKTEQQRISEKISQINLNALINGELL